MWIVEDEDVNARIRRQAKANADGQRAMERLVLEAKRAGKSLRAIAPDAAMSQEGVRKMIARAMAAEAGEAEAAAAAAAAKDADTADEGTPPAAAG